MWSFVLKRAWGVALAIFCVIALLWFEPAKGQTAGSAISTQPSSATVTEGSTATFTVGAVAAGSTFQWYKNGVPLAGATSASLTLAKVEPTDAGSYSASVSGFAGSARSNSAVLAVAPQTVGGSQVFLGPWSETQPISASVNLNDVAFAPAANGVDGYFGAVAADGSFWYADSANLGAWSATTGGASGASLNAVIAAGPNAVVAVGNGGAIVRFTFAAGGNVSVLPENSGTGARLNAVASSGTRWVAVGNGGTIVSTTSDAAQRGGGWTAAVSPTTVDLMGVAYGNGTFVAVGWSAGQGSVVLRSADGITWSQPAPTPGGLPYTTVAFGQGQGVFATQYVEQFFTSPDGSTWTAHASPDAVVIFRLTYAQGAFVGVGESGIVVTSVDGGQTWSISLSTGGTNDLHGVAYGASRFVAVGDKGTVAQTVPLVPAQLINLSARGQASSGAGALVAGFVAGPGGGPNVLLRGVGPTLAQFGISDPLSHPQLTVYDSAGATIGADAQWGGDPGMAAEFQTLGAFALPSGSADSALWSGHNGFGLGQLPPSGLFTAQVTGANGASGDALLEIYDADHPDPSRRLINLSSRANVAGTSGTLTVGFVVSGTTPEHVLLRGVGPALNGFGLSGLATPSVTLYDAQSNPIATNAGWSVDSSLSAIFTSVGAFSLPSGSGDAALQMTLAPGLYTLIVSGLGGSSGAALAEIYEIPSP